MDGFPQTCEQWMAMADSSILPDTVLILEVDEDNADILLKRFMTVTGLADSSVYCSKQNKDQQIEKQDKGKEEEVSKVNMYQNNALH